MPPSTSYHHKHSRHPRQSSWEPLLGVPLPLPAFREQGILIWSGSVPAQPSRTLPEPLSWSPAAQPRFTLCPPPDKGSTIDPGAARSRLCQEMQFTTSSEVTAEEASRPLALLCRYKKPFKGPLCEPQLSLQHGRREVAESREHTAPGLPFKLPNQIPNPRNLFLLSENLRELRAGVGHRVQLLHPPGCAGKRTTQSGPFLIPHRL